MASRRIGDITAKQTPESKAVHLASQTEEVTYVFRGDLAELRTLQGAAKPGTYWVHDSAAMGWVLTADLKPEAGGIGTLTAVCSTRPEEGTGDDAVVKTKYETDSARIDKPLLSHPGITEEMRVRIAAWAQDKPADFKFTDSTGSEETLSKAEQIWAGKMLAGVESYLFFAPVVTRVREYRFRPGSSGIGQRGTPPIAPGSFKWLKTGDRATQDDRGRWTRTETWEGAEKWDTDIYD